MEWGECVGLDGGIVEGADRADCRCRWGHLGRRRRLKAGLDPFHETILNEWDTAVFGGFNAHENL